VGRGIDDLRRAAVVLTAVTAAFLGAGPAVARAADPVYGVSVHAPLKARDYSEMKRGGVESLRMEISWEETQRDGGALDWSRTDNRIRQAAEHGFEVVPYLTGSPRWAKSCREGRCHVPTGPEADGWLRFVKGAVERYGAGGGFWPAGPGRVTLPITTWQVWSAANRSVSPRAYGALLEATYRTIKLADPTAFVLTGGLSYGAGKGRMRPARFLRELLRSDGKNSFSAVAVTPQSRSVKQVEAQVDDVRGVLSAKGRGSIEIWVMPIGWASSRKGSAMAVGLAGQRSRLKRSMERLRPGLGIQGVFWSRWRDGRGGCRWCRRSGLVTGKGRPKPAWKAFERFLKKLDPEDPHIPDPGPFFFGVSPEHGQMTEADLSLMEGAGVGAVRFLITWQDVMASDGSFDWASTDGKFRELALRGIDPLPQLFGDPKKVSQVNDPTLMDRWRRFVAAAVSRYRPGSPFWQQFAAAHPGVPVLPPPVWQIYNEQNTWGYWPGGPSAVQFAKLLHISAGAIRGADPTAKIMLGGMLGNDNMNGTPSWEFLRQLYLVPGARNDFDIVAAHPYGFSLDDISWELGKVREALVAANDAATPIWITEIGWGSTFDDNPAKHSWWERDPQGQADMLVSMWGMMLRNQEAWNLRGVFWYTWRDPGFRACSFCWSAGLLENDFTPKPSFTAFEQLVRLVRGGQTGPRGCSPHPAGPLCYIQRSRVGSALLLVLSRVHSDHPRDLLRSRPSWPLRTLPSAARSPAFRPRSTFPTS